MNNSETIQSTRKVKVFLSSTFRDLEDERDYLAKNTFEYLEIEALKNNIILKLLDLRWGVTEEESRNGLVTQICLNEIENSRPFFIGIIGERYGWIPDIKDLDDNHELFSTFPWIKEDINNGLSLTEIEIQYGVLRNKEKVNAFFFIKRDSACVEGEEERTKLNKLKTALLTQNRYPVKYYSCKEELGELIKEDILMSLKDLFPVQIGIDNLARSNSIQKGIVQAKSETYTPINNYFDYINNFVISPQRLLVIRGESGTGKSALLAYWIKNFENRGAFSVVYHFINTAYNCDEPDFILLRLYRDICYSLDLVPDITTDNYHQFDIQKEINIILTNSEKKFIYVIDGLNQLARTKDAYTLAWLPKATQNFKVICSITDDVPELTISLDNKSGVFYDLEILKDSSISTQIINDYFRNFGKKLSPSQIIKIQNNNIYKKPLILFLLLNEIRLYGNFDELNNFIALFESCKDEESFFDLVFKRLEKEHLSKSHQVVGDILLLLAISRNGLSDTDISSILNIPQIYVSTLLFQCHHFISPLGITFKISHDIVKNNILIRYKCNTDRYNKVVELYTEYLENKINDSTPSIILRNYIYELINIYRDNENFNKLQGLCVKPIVFLLLYQLYYRELVNICSILSKQQLSILEVYDNLSTTKPLSNEIEGNGLRVYLLKCLRTICRDAKSLNEYERAIDLSDRFFNSNESSDEYTIDFLCDKLEYLDLVDDIKHGIALSNLLLDKIEDSDKNIDLLSKVYYHKGHLLRKDSFEESASLIKKSIEYSKRENEITVSVVSLINLAISYAQHSYYNQAFEIYSEAENLIEESIKERPSLIIQQYSCWKNMSVLYNRTGNIKEELRYRKKAGLCYLKILHSEYQPLLHLSTIIDEKASFADMMMRNGDLKDGIKEFKETLELLEKEKDNFSQIEHLSLKIEITNSFANCYATNGMFGDALDLLMSIESIFHLAINNYPTFFADRYLLYLQKLAVLFSDLHCHKTSCAYFDMSISEYQIVINQQAIGIKSFLPDTYLKYSRVLFKHEDFAAAFNYWDKASELYLQLSSTNKEYFKRFVDTKLELFHCLVYTKNIDNYSYDSIRLLFDNLNGSIGDSEDEKKALWLYAGVKLIMLALEQERINEVEDVILLISYAVNETSSNDTMREINYIIALSCSELSRYKFYNELKIKDSLVLSLLSDKYFNICNISTQEYISVSYNLQHCANCYDKMGDIENAYKYYNAALEKLNDIPNKTTHVVYREGGILYDYGVAAYNCNNINFAEDCFSRAIQCFKKIYDEKSNAALQLADAEQALANIYDDTEKYERAEELYKSAIYVLENATSDFSDVANERLGLTLNNYGIMLLKSYRIEDARRILNYSRNIRIKYDKWGLIRTDDSLYRLSIYNDNIDDAIEYLGEILNVFADNGIVENSQLNEFFNYTDKYAVLCLQNNKSEKAMHSYKILYETVMSNLNQEIMRDDDKKNLCIIMNRVIELFGNSDFLNS